MIQLPSKKDEYRFNRNFIVLVVSVITFWTFVVWLVGQV